jgi:selenide,water dikinase
LTKPLGFGVTTTALKREQADEKDVEQAVTWMKKLNRDASRLAVEMNLTGATDITGYSLLGHSSEMANASHVQIRYIMDNIPFIDGAEKYASMGTFPGGASDNRMFFGKNVRFAETIDELHQMLLFDPQTSGGLLLCVPETLVQTFKKQAEKLSQPVWEIGEVLPGSGIVVE